MAGLSWLSIFRIGLVQTALGAMILLTQSTLNRVMTVELKMLAVIPGALLALHHAIQTTRPRWGYASDVGGRRTPWIIGGLAVLGSGVFLASLSTAWMAINVDQGLSPGVGAFLLAIGAYILVGFGVGASGTSLLAMLAAKVAPARRAPAATIVWLMMVAGFVVTAASAGSYLKPFSPQRLVMVTAWVVVIAFVVAVIAIWGVERSVSAVSEKPQGNKASFSEALRLVWAEPKARAFTVFVFISMFAYNTQDLILEPFAGWVFGMEVGESTKLSGTHHSGVFLGMIALAFLAGGKRPRFGNVQTWTTVGCIASGIVLIGIVASGFVPGWPIKPTVMALGFANGLFAAAAIAWMMGLAGEGQSSQEGMRMGLWGGAQAIGFALGSFLGTVGVDVVRFMFDSRALSYAVVFGVEALLFFVSAVLASKMKLAASNETRATKPVAAVPAVSLSDRIYDAVVVGGGPAGATAATELARAGKSVVLLDRAGRIKPCGGAIPPRLIRDFDIPHELLCAQIRSARIVSPTDRKVDMPIDGGFVGMVNREVFDEFLRSRAATEGAERRIGLYEHISREEDGTVQVHYRAEAAPGAGAKPMAGPIETIRTRLVVGADGARSQVARQEVPGGGEVKCVFAYHEVVSVPDAVNGLDYDGHRCDVVYNGKISPDFYGWVFPHGSTASIGTGSANKGFSLRRSVADLRSATGLDGLTTVRKEGAPIPMEPLRRWDNGRDVVLAGDAAGVVAPSSGEGIYYAMLGGQVAGQAGLAFLNTADARALAQARKRFMKDHGRVFWILGMMQWFFYSNDNRRERFVTMCEDKDVQRLTWQAYMNKELVRADPMAHARIFVKDMAHLMGLVSVEKS